MRIKNFLIALLVQLISFNASAYQAYIDGIYYNFSGSTATVTYKDIYNNNYSGSVVIPASFTFGGKTYTVTRIGESAFDGCSGLTSVNIPNSVTRIDVWAFSGCSGLTSITIPNSVTNIAGAFLGCSGLTSIKVNNGNTKYDSRDGCNAIIETATNTLIVGCKKTVIPNSVTSIDLGAFYGCSGLTSITIPNRVTSIGSGAFQDCSGLTSITIPNSVTSIGSEAFDETAWYNTQPDGLVYAGKVAYKYKGYVPEGSIVVLKEGTLGIADEAFSGCSGLTSVTIPNSVTSIGSGAFNNCSGLTSVIIPNSVTSICSGAFKNCNSLPSITIPNSVSSIDGSVFYGCNGLTSVTIPNSVTSIGGYAFSGCNGLTSVTIPNSVTSIGGYAFSGCSGLTSITIPNSVTSISKKTFSDCNSLTSVTLESNDIVSTSRTSDTSFKTIFGEQVNEYVIGNAVESVGNYAFSGCSGLTSVTIGNSVTRIGEKAFSECSSLTSVTLESDDIVSASRSSDKSFKSIFGEQVNEYVIGNAVESIGNYAFYGCSGLTSVTIPNSVTSIGEEAFYYCSGLTSVTIPNSVTSIGNYAFESCSSLASVHIKDMAAWCKISFSYPLANPLYYAHHLYLNGEEVKNLLIPNSVTNINDYAFYGCSGLISITIPNSVNSIGNATFYGCNNLMYVKIDATYPPTIYSNCFSNSANATLYIPSGCKSAYVAADYWKEFKKKVEYPSPDVNHDEKINVVDVVDIARYVVGNPAQTFLEFLADINKDGIVNLGDAVVLVNEIAGEQNFVKSWGALTEIDANDALSLTEKDCILSLNLENERHYTAFQFNLNVPEGTDVTQMLLNAERRHKHQLLYNKIKDGHYRVAALSTSNNEFNGNSGELLNMSLVGGNNCEVSIRDIKFFDAKGQEYQFEDIEGAVATGIKDLPPAVSQGEGYIYNLQGHKRESLQRGINIVGDKKMIVK